MGDRTFEEQVRAGMEDLRLKPEEQVWHNVEAAIRQRRKRRWLIWPLALLALGGSVWVYNMMIGTGPGTNTGTTKTNDKLNKNNTPVITVNDTILPATPGSPAAASVNTSATKLSNNGPGAASVSLAAVAKVKEQPLAKTNHAGSQKTPATVPLDAASELPATGSNETSKEMRDKKTGNTTTEPERAIENADKKAAENIPASTDRNNIAGGKDLRSDSLHHPLQTLVITPSSADTAATIPASETITVTKNERGRKAWKFYLVPGIGVSGEKNVDPNSGLLFASNPSNVGNGQASPGGIIYKTPSYTSGLYLGLQLQALKPVGKKSSVGISLGYTSYSSKMGVGRPADSVSAQYAAFSGRSTADAGIAYRSSDSSYYTNRFHFAELGLDYYRNIRIGTNGLLRWHLGTGVALLLGSNALHYDAASGLLFRNRSLIPGLQTYLSTGFDVSPGKTRSFYIGPRFSYFMSRTSELSGSSRHLFNAALRLGFAVPKKKK